MLQSARGNEQVDQADEEPHRADDQTGCGKVRPQIRAHGETDERREKVTEYLPFFFPPEVVNNDREIDAHKTEQTAEIQKFGHNRDVEENRAEYTDRRHNQNIVRRRFVLRMQMREKSFRQQTVASHAVQKAGRAGLTGKSSRHRGDNDRNRIRDGEPFAADELRHFKKRRVLRGEGRVIRPDELR